MNLPRKHPPTRLWRALAESPWLPITAYLGLVGVLGIASGAGVAPRSLDVTLPDWLVMAWTVGIAVGGLAATAGCLWSRTRVESAGLALLAYGAALYGAVVSAVV